MRQPEEEREEMAASNEKIIAALLNTGTIKEAAKEAGISVRALHDRMKTQDFRVDYQEAKNDILRYAVNNINTHLSEAIETVCTIMKDTNINAAIRLQAAQTIINNATKFNDKLSDEETTASKIDRSFADELEYMNF